MANENQKGQNLEQKEHLKTYSDPHEWWKKVSSDDNYDQNDPWYRLHNKGLSSDNKLKK
ncbi:hypothetical protein WR164_03050 [Philodulcilactobacillus myokoensis]|uniref:Uncharacterized protein n=1 Tax=Philodulcilactobacillus myokoensis TaxID=2929573 RepID=A0A9W6ER75_9LACO|nr:hypothetical protein [Philodulcilactobacillus myokoensis]GLB46326.1 hypothetical protein WR164_03050 [Philodulcilactobacillus myokoensis]